MESFKLISPANQRTWRWPAVANFLLGGAGTGLYLITVLEGVIHTGDATRSNHLVFELIALALVIAGFCALSIEAGRPWRARHLLHNLRHAWISRDTLAFAFFVSSVILGQFFPHPAFRFIAVLAAFGVMIGQGFTVYRARAVTAWNVPSTPFLFLSSGFASGVGLALMLPVSKTLSTTYNLVAIGLICVIANLVIWFFYLYWSPTAAFQAATKNLRRPIALFITAGLGHFLPLLLLSLLAISLRGGTEVRLAHTFMVISGFAMIGGVMAQKAGIILAAGYIREVNLTPWGDQTHI